MRRGIWRTYRLLRAYCRRPTRARRAVVHRRFERTFRPNTSIRMIDDQITRSLNNHEKLLGALADRKCPFTTTSGKTTFAPASAVARSQAAPARMQAVTAATPSSPS